MYQELSSLGYTQENRTYDGSCTFVGFYPACVEGQTRNQSFYNLRGSLFASGEFAIKWLPLASFFLEIRSLRCKLREFPEPPVFPSYLRS